MRHRDKIISSVSDLVKSLKDHAPTSKQIWFRGQSKSSWNLVPSLARKKSHIAAEMALIKRFKQNAVPHLQEKPSTEWEWLFLMQHHRLPTRLLDWSESPLVALYFAVNSNPRSEGAMWCLDPVELNKNANINFRFSLETPAFDHDEILNNYLPHVIASETTSDLSSIAAIASRNSPRITAQLGAFTISHRNFTSLEEVGDKSHVWRLVIPANKKVAIQDELALLRYSELALFPELDTVAENAKELLQ